MKTKSQKPVIFDRMAKKRKSGEHVTKRKPVQLPLEWYLLANKLASARKQPMSWYLLSKIAEDAEKDGLKRPELPWEEEAGAIEE